MSILNWVCGGDSTSVGSVGSKGNLGLKRGSKGEFGEGAKDH